MTCCTFVYSVINFDLKQPIRVLHNYNKSLANTSCLLMNIYKTQKHYNYLQLDGIHKIIKNAKLEGLFGKTCWSD